MAEVRAALREVRKTLASIEARLIRRSPTKRAKPSSTPMTPRLYEDIREWAAENPEMTMVEIAAQFNVNPGRVSEVLSDLRAAQGPRGEDETPMLPIGMPDRP